MPCWDWEILLFPEFSSHFCWDLTTGKFPSVTLRVFLMCLAVRKKESKLISWPVTELTYWDWRQPWWLCTFSNTHRYGNGFSLLILLNSPCSAGFALPSSCLLGNSHSFVHHSWRSGSVVQVILFIGLGAIINPMVPVTRICQQHQRKKTSRVLHWFLYPPWGHSESVCACHITIVSVSVWMCLYRHIHFLGRCYWW